MYRGEGSSRRGEFRITDGAYHNFSNGFINVSSIVRNNMTHPNTLSNTPLEGLWGLINVLQLISYTMLLPLLFPKNLLIFLEAIALVHGFNKFVPNLFKYLIFDDDYHEQSFNSTFKSRGFDNRTMILLVGSEFTLFLIIFLIIGFLLLLKKCLKY